MEEIRERIEKREKKDAVTQMTFIFSKFTEKQLERTKGSSLSAQTFRTISEIVLKIDFTHLFSVLQDIFNSQTVENWIPLWEKLREFREEMKQCLEKKPALKYEALKMSVEMYQKVPKFPFVSFRAEILFFLSSLLSLEDKSGLNLKGVVNSSFDYNSEMTSSTNRLSFNRNLISKKFHTQKKKKKKEK